MSALLKFLTVLMQTLARWLRWRARTAPQREGDKIRSDVAKGDEDAVNKDIADALRR